MRVIAGLALAGLLAASACRHDKTAPPKAPPVHTVDDEMLRSITVLATGEPPSAEVMASVHADIAAGTLTVPQYIDRLLADERFSNNVAPLLVLRQLLTQNALGVPQGASLMKTEGDRPVYYLYKPCKWEEGVDVKPWWNLIEGRHDTVRVCKDSYNPDQWTAQVPPGEPEMSCLSEYAWSQETGTRCGCGPNLIRCFGDDESFLATRAGIFDEVRKTIAYVVANGRPMEEAFTGNETFRDRFAEFMQREFKAESQRKAIPEEELLALAQWPKAGKWAPREDLAPGQNAGILTSPQIVHFQADRRQRMTAIYDVMWCVDVKSIGATPEQMLSIAGGDLQLKSSGWQELAARPICTTCHARLDYGQQFFWGFANDNIQAYFVPALQQKGKGPLYAQDIEDPRGEGELNPRGFAALAVAQPEFRRCVARDVGEYVLGNDITPEHLAALESNIRPGSAQLREVMRQALEVFVREWPSRHRMPAAMPAVATKPSPTTEAPRAQTVALTGALREHLDKYCMDCHDKEADRVDLSVATLDRKATIEVIDAVAFGRMPKDDPMPAPERARMIEPFLHALWSDADATAARAYYIDRSLSLPSYRPEVIFELIHRSAGAKGTTGWRMMENAVRSDVQQLTPGLVTLSGLAAIEACREAHKTREERDRCISDAVKLENLTGQAP